MKKTTRSFAAVLSFALAFSSLPASALAAGSMAAVKTGVPLSVGLNPGKVAIPMLEMGGSILPVFQPAPLSGQEIITNPAEPINASGILLNKDAPPAPVAKDQKAILLGHEMTENIGAAVQQISKNSGNLSTAGMYDAGVNLENAITGAQSFAPSGAVSDPDDSRSWFDSFTGGYETETSKLHKAYQLALTNSRAKAIKDNLPVNPVYKVQAGDAPFYARAVGDDPERPGEDAAVIFDQWTLQNLSPHFIAATLASMWVRHLYRDVVPQSAEKTYMEGSILIRVFKELTGSTANNWVGRLDHWLDGNFQIYRHFYHWVKGFQYDNVRQGPYFKDKIMGAQGDPSIYTDARGRKTLFQRSRDGEISDDAATQAQNKFDQFVRTEQQ